MTMATTYDPMDLTVTVGGIYITGFSEDMVEFEKDEDAQTAKVGSQGDVVMTKVNNPLGTLTLTLFPTSPQVAYLDKLARTGTLVPISIIFNGEPKETITVTQAFVKKPATRTYGNEAEDRQYEIQCLDHVVE
nr:phage protein [Paenibacillus antarcticus]